MVKRCLRCVFSCHASWVLSQVIYDYFWLSTSLSIIVNTIVGHCFCIIFFFSSVESNLFMWIFFLQFTALKPLFICKTGISIYWGKKSDIFNLLSEPAGSSQRLNTTLLLLLLSGRGKAPLLNASLLTSIMTVSGIEKPGRRRRRRHADDSQPQSAEF